MNNGMEQILAILLLPTSVIYQLNEWMLNDAKIGTYSIFYRLDFYLK